MARSGITQAQVNEAADALLRGGERPTIERVSRVARALLAVPVGATARLAGGDAAADVALAEWLALPAVAAATGWNEWQGEAFVAQEPFEDWLGALGFRDATAGTADAPALARAAIDRVAAAGFRVPAPGTVQDDVASPADPVPTTERPSRGKRSRG